MCKSQHDQWAECAQEYLKDDLREKELGVNHEVQAAERFVCFVDAMDQVQHFQAEIEDERIEEIHCDGVYAAHVDDFAAQFGYCHVQHHDAGNARNHG